MKREGKKMQNNGEMKVKVYGKEKMEKGFMILEPDLGAVKVVFINKVIVVTADQKVKEYEQAKIPLNVEEKK